MTINDKDHADVIMLPPIILLIALVAAVILDFTGILHFLPLLWSAAWAVLLGLVLFVGAGALGASALRTFSRVGTNVSPHEPTLTLATTGPYRFTRNPMYLGFVLMLAGLSLIFSLEWGLILVPVLALILHFGVIVREEHYLSAKFGQAYEEFMGRTRRWL